MREKREETHARWGGSFGLRPRKILRGGLSGTRIDVNLVDRMRNRAQDTKHVALPLHFRIFVRVIGEKEKGGGRGRR